VLFLTIGLGVYLSNQTFAFILKTLPDPQHCLDSGTLVKSLIEVSVVYFCLLSL
jgi:hypothetical protein